jgi:hypothetical protein
MINKLNVSKGNIFLACFYVSTFIFLFAQGAEAWNLKVCAHWRAYYTDASNGEDFLTSRTGANYGARYAGYQVLNSSGTTISSGYLDSSGCTPYLTVNSNSTYDFVLKSVFSRATNRTIYVQPESSTTWGNSYVTSTTNFTTDSHSSSYYGKLNLFNIAPTGWVSNMGAIVSRLISHANTVSWASNWTIYLRHRNASNGCGANGQVTINNDPANGEMYKKFVVIHELGHAIGDGGTYHMKSSNYSLAVDDSNLCNCPRSSGIFRADTNHCLTSKEYIRAAQNEGFAHFIATVLNNDRNENSAYFGYYKYLLRSGSEGDTPTSPPVKIRVDTREKWMETHCDPGNQDQGTEWDWMTFFWDLFSNNGNSNSTKRWSISEILDAWPTDTTDSEAARAWDVIYNSLPSGEKKTWFYTLSGVTGVDHYTP